MQFFIENLKMKRKKRQNFSDLPERGFELGFPTGRDSATFQDKGTEVPSLSREKGKKGQKFLHCLGTKRQQDELKILLRDGTGFLQAVPAHPIPW